MHRVHTYKQNTHVHKRKLRVLDKVTLVQLSHPLLGLIILYRVIEVQGQPGLQGKFQDSQGYTVRLCLKKLKKILRKKDVLVPFL